jgi:hypothetical protein
VSKDRKEHSGGLSVTTLMIASASSLVAALVVSKLWGGGTLIGAALTPVIVAIVSEGLRKPADVIVTVRQTRAPAVYDPVAEGRRGLAEGDLSSARPARPGAEPERRVHRTSAAARGADEARAGDTRASRTSTPRRRLRLGLAVATGLVAFVVAGVVLTGSELVLGNSVVSSAKRTTFVPAKTSNTSDSDKTKTDTDAKTTPANTTSTETTPPAEQTTPTTTTAPGAQTPQPGAAPAAPPPAQTAPAPSPPPNQPVPAPQTTPAPAAPAQ